MDIRITTIVACLAAMTVAAGCASTNVTGRERLTTGPLPRPGQIWVYNFAATPDDVPADSALAGQMSAPATPPTDEQMTLGRQLGAAIASELVEQIRGMGMPAAQAGPGTRPQINDIVFRGYLVSVEPGSAAKRMTIGFGSGGSELKTVGEGFQMTANGLRKLGSATVGAESGKAPGASLGAVGWLITGNPVGLIVGGGMKVYGEASGSATVEGRAKATAKEFADLLKERFKEEGWIQ